MRHHLTYSRPALVVLALACLAAPLASASQIREASIGYSVRVTAAEAPVHAQADAGSSVFGRVRSADILVVVGKQGDWYRVRLPRDRKATPSGPDAGYVQARFVTVAGPGGATGVAGTPARPVPGKAQPGAQGWGSLQFRPFGEVAFQAFSANESFNAIFDSSTGVFYGGGVDLALGRSLRLATSITHFARTGQRAFAYEGEAYPLGVEARVSITPITFNLTYRFPGRRFIPYLGGGAGAVAYGETSEYATDEEDVNKTGTAVQVLAGVEIALGSALSLAVEGQYQSVTGILGDSGVSQAFSEKDLGGVSVRARILFGR